jgi:error-prone DNA polymerase
MPVQSLSGYTELAVQSNFSFLCGASHPEELAATAARLGLAGFGLTDRNSVAGVVRAHTALKEIDAKLRYHPGCRLVFADATPDILAYPASRKGWGQLTRLLTLGNRRSEKGSCHLTGADLLAHSSDLACIVMPHAASQTELPVDDAIGLAPAAETFLADLAQATGAKTWLAALCSFAGDDRARLQARDETARRLRLPLVAVNDVLYHIPNRRPLQDVLTCIRTHTTIDSAGRRLEANAERHLKSASEMVRLFRTHPEAITETERFSARLAFSLDELRYEYPDESVAGFETPQAALIHFTYAGADERYPYGVPMKVRLAIAHEIALIGELHYAPYFLTVFDIVRFARAKGILCQGRGSAANSAVCFCLGITEIDPAKSDLLFERFVSADRREPPDIDVDFEHTRREEVIQYIYQRYGRERAGLAATVISYRARSAIREVGKAMGLAGDTLDALSGSIWGFGGESIATMDLTRAGIDGASPRVRQTLALARAIIGFPRHLSQHVGGFVMTRGRLDELVPIQNAAMPDRTVIEWDKDDLAALGLLKVDVLALGMLTCLKNAFTLAKRHYGEHWSIATLPAEDPAVYRMLTRADSLGVFQVESRAQMSMLPRLAPQTFYDLVIEVAIVRPGPIQGDMVHPYLRRRQGLEPVRFPSKALEEVLGKTLGVPLFQEQAMRIAIVAAGFTPSEADRLRRAMATFRKVGTISTFQDKMIEGMVNNGYDRAFAERCFRQIEGFGEYGFPESHAASFALLVYASSWVKCHYPDIFAAALLNAQPLGFYAPAQIVRDAREHGVDVRPVDINASDWDATLEAAQGSPSEQGFHHAHQPGRQPPERSSSASPQQPTSRPALHRRHAEQAADIRTTHALRLGLREIKGLPEAAARLVVEKRGNGYDSVRDLWLRTKLDRAHIERLADADAFATIGLARRDALWAVKALGRTGDHDDLPLFSTTPSATAREADVHLPAMPLGEEVVHDYRFLRLSLKAHPMQFIRAALDGRRVVIADHLDQTAPGRRILVAGLVLVRQRPGTAKGVIFMTLEDESGVVNVIVWAKTFERLRPVVLGARAVIVRGILQREAGVTHIVAEHIEDATPQLACLSEEFSGFNATARGDEVKRPQPDMREKRVESAIKRRERMAHIDPAMHAIADLDVPARATRHALPRGRNFR